MNGGIPPGGAPSGGALFGGVPLGGALFGGVPLGGALRKRNWKQKLRRKKREQRCV